MNLLPLSHQPTTESSADHRTINPTLKHQCHQPTIELLTKKKDQEPYSYQIKPSKVLIYGRSDTEELGHGDPGQSDFMVRNCDFMNFLTNLINVKFCLINKKQMVIL